jgi:oxygen-independent coproporphyrinogen III oxidase
VRDATVGVYFHVPFCQRICPYCDFPVVAARRLAPEAEAAVVAGLARELEVRQPAFAGRVLASVYLGGGTPSLLAPEAVARLVASARAAFVPGKRVEVTLEVNPSTVERARLPAFREAGVNRVSVGVQSFDDTLLRRLGRAHRAGEARATLEAARRAGFDDVSLDLIFGVPGQDLAALHRDLDAALAFAPEHVSAYTLSVEAGTPYARAVARGRLVPPGEDDAAAMLEALRARLAAAGLPAYEISSYAQPGREAVHNRRYWARRPVLGVGMGAWSLDPPAEGAPFGVRRGNERSLEAWLARLARRPAEPPLADVLDAATARGEAAFLALRTAEGLRAAAFEVEFGAPPRAFFGASIEALCAAGLLEERPGGDLRLLERGVLLADTVAAHFV